MHLVNAVFHKQLSKVWDRTGCDYVRYLFSSLATAWLCFIVALVGGMHMIVYTLIAVSYLTLTFIWFMMCQDLANGNALNRRTTFWWPWTFAGVCRRVLCGSIIIKCQKVRLGRMDHPVLELPLCLPVPQCRAQDRLRHRHLHDLFPARLVAPPRSPVRQRKVFPHVCGPGTLAVFAPLCLPRTMPTSIIF